MKAQLSLEFLVILSALAAFLLAFLPVYSQAQQNAKAKIVEQAQSLAFSQITALARQAEILGKQNSLAEKIRFQADNTSFAFDGQTTALKMRFDYAGKTREVEEKLGFQIAVPEGAFPKGDFRAVAENDGATDVGMILRMETQGKG